ncbi:hypothetical protein ACH5RR_023545 [Cinchona calisaya]|uniref:Uncharacterized protein n=1 Tax=Cinchona calisaya TaxID=153742 RepID=A0ABD2ZB20_9GENT
MRKVRSIEGEKLVGHSELAVLRKLVVVAAAAANSEDKMLEMQELRTWKLLKEVKTCKGDLMLKLPHLIENTDEGLENEDSSSTKVFHDNDYDSDNEGELFKKTNKEAEKMADWSAITSHFQTRQNNTQPEVETCSNASEQKPIATNSEELNSNAIDEEGDEINERSNLGSTMLLASTTNDDGDEVFGRLSVHFQACKEGFLAADGAIAQDDACASGNIENNGRASVEPTATTKHGQ